MSYTWPVDRTCLPDLDETATDQERVQLQEAIDTAVMVLWALTGRTYAVEDVIARPCPRLADSEEIAQWGTGWGLTHGFVPLLIDGRWQNWTGCGSDCTPEGKGVVRLPGPVAAVQEVRVDGVLIDPASYVLEGDLLYRTHGGEWPAQERSLPLGEPGTWSVAYQRGIAPPAGAAGMVGTLALEFWNMCQGTGQCRLPNRWQSIQRAGVSIQRADPTDILAQGYTGLPEVDAWIRALNPHNITQPTRLVTPDYANRGGL